LKKKKYDKYTTWVSDTGTPYDRTIVLDRRGKKGLNPDFLARVWEKGKGVGTSRWPHGADPDILVVDRRMRIRPGDATGYYSYEFGNKIPSEWFALVEQTVLEDFSALTGGRIFEGNFRLISPYTNGQTIDRLPENVGAVVVYFAEKQGFPSGFGGFAAVNQTGPGVYLSSEAVINIGSFLNPNQPNDRRLISHEVVGHALTGMTHVGGSSEVPGCSIMGCNTPLHPFIDRPTPYDILTGRFLRRHRSIGATAGPDRDVNPMDWPEFDGLYPNSSSSLRIGFSNSTSVFGCNLETGESWERTLTGEETIEDLFVRGLVPRR